MVASALLTAPRLVKRKAVVNASVGVEVLVTPSFPFRTGFWTDFSAAPEPTGADDEPQNDSRMHRFGGSLGVGLRGEHTESNISLQVSYASGTGLIPNDLDFTELRPTDQHELGAYLVFATSFQF